MTSVLVHRLAVAAAAVLYVASLGALAPASGDVEAGSRSLASVVSTSSSVADGSLKNVFKNDGSAMVGEVVEMGPGSWEWTAQAEPAFAGPGGSVAAVAVWGDGSEVKSRPERLDRTPILAAPPSRQCAGKACGKTASSSAGMGVALGLEGPSSDRMRAGFGEALMAGSRAMLVVGADAAL